MSRHVTPVDPCQNCGERAPCYEVEPPPRYHSGWECNCGEVRWGGVLSAGHSVIGYSFSHGYTLCWRCHRANCSKDDPIHATNYPRLPYLSGYMTTLWSDGKGPFDRHCDECGNLVAPST